MSLPDSVDWFAPVGSDCRNQLDRLWLLADGVRTRAEGGYTLRTILHQQYNQVVDPLIDAGVLDSRGNFARGKDFPTIAPTLAIATMYSSAGARRVLEQFLFKNRLAISTMCRAFFMALENEMVVPAFSDLRAILEHVAHACYTMRLCEAVPSASYTTPEGANLFLSEVNGILVKSNYATRIEWKGLFAGPTPLRERKSSDYESSTSRIDIRAKSIATPLDKLEKEVLGVNNVYDFLCEFTHPNVGTHFAFIERTEGPESDSRGILWKGVVIGPGIPESFINEVRRFSGEIIGCVADCVERFLTAEKQMDALGMRLKGASQLIARKIILLNPGLFDPYELCPCLSGSKVRFCCGSPRNRPA